MTLSGSTTLPTTTRRIVGLCGVVVLVDTLFYAVLSPLLPAYAEQAGITPGQTGLLVAAYPLGTVFGALPAGALASRRGPRVAVVMGMSVTMVTSLLFAAATTTPELIGFRFLQGIGGALSWTGAMVWVSAVSPSNRRGELLGALLGLSVVGGVLGPAVGALASITSPALVFRGIAALCFGLVLLTLLASGSDTSPTQRVGWRRTLPQLRDRRILLGLWLTAYAGSAFGVINTSAPLALSALGLSGTAVSAVFLVMASVGAVASPLIGRHSDRHGREMATRLLLLVAIASVVLVGVASAVWVLIPVLVIAATSLESIYVPAGALVVDGCAATRADSAAVLSLTNLVWASGMAVASLLTGVLAVGTPGWTPYVLVALVGLLTLPALRPHPAESGLIDPNQGFSGP